MDLLETIVTLLIGSAVFITGMNMMSSGLKKATGKGLKRFFRKTQDNGVACFGIGAAVTALIQSSAATSVMAIGFIGAGVLTVYQAVAIMLGSYVGTTITGVLASLSSFKFSTYIMLVGFLGIVLMFFKNEKVKNYGEIATGLGLLFFGLKAMSDSIKSNATISDGIAQLFTNIGTIPVVAPILLVIVGALFTALVQSSSATTGVVIVLLSSGALADITLGFYLVIGATIGTMITTYIATIGGNLNAKRCTFIATVIKVVAAIIGVIVVAIVGKEIGEFLIKVFGNNQFALAMFLVLYSAIFYGLSLLLIKPLIKLTDKVIKDKSDEERKHVLKFIDVHLLDTPTIALMQTKREIENMMVLSFSNYKLGYQRLVYGDESNDKTLIEREEDIDYINKKISDFLIQLTNKVSTSDERKVGTYFHVINDIERIGDHAYNFYEMSQEMKTNELEFSELARSELQQMHDVVLKMFELALMIFDQKDFDQLPQLHVLEDRTDELKRQLSEAHFDRIVKNECKNELSPYYSSLISELERIADHLVNVGYSIVNPTGDDDK